MSSAVSESEGKENLGFVSHRGKVNSAIVRDVPTSGAERERGSELRMEAWTNSSEVLWGKSQRDRTERGCAGKPRGETASMGSKGLLHQC